MISFICADCKTGFHLAEDFAGSTVVCLTCGGRLVVPHPDGQAAAMRDERYDQKVAAAAPSWNSAFELPTDDCGPGLPNAAQATWDSVFELPVDNDAAVQNTPLLAWDPAFDLKVDDSIALLPKANAMAVVLAPRRTWPLVLAGVVLAAGIVAGAFLVWDNAPVQLVIEVEPAGATVFVDGRETASLGPEAREVTVSLRPGEHELRIDHDGFQTYSRKLVLAARTSEVVHAQLEPLPKPKVAPPSVPEPVKMPVQALEAPTQVVKAPIEAVKAPIEAVKAPTDPVKAPIDPVKAPIEPVKPPIELPKAKAIAVRPTQPGVEIMRNGFIGDDGNPAHVYYVAFAPTGRYFLAAGDAGERSPVRVYDAGTGKLVSQFSQGSAGWSGGRLSPDGTKVVSWGSSSASLFLWESATARQLLQLEGQPGELTITNGETAEKFLPAPGHQVDFSTAAFSPDGKKVICGSVDRMLRVWDAHTGKVLLTLKGHAEICAGCFSPDGKWIVSYSNDKTVRAWNAATGQAMWVQTEQSARGMANMYYVHNRCFAPNGRVLCLGGDNAVRVLDLATGKLLARLTTSADVLGAAFIRNGQQLVCWAEDRTLRVWDMDGGKLVRTINLGADLQAEPDHVTVSPDGRLLLTAHTDRTLRIRDLATSEEVQRFDIAPGTGLRSLAVSPDSRLAAAGSFRGWVYLWRLPVMP